MKPETFKSIMRLVAADPLTMAQHREISETGEETMVSPAEVASMMDISVDTLERLPITRIKLSRKTVKYRLSDVRRYIASVAE